MDKILIISYYWPPAGGPGVQRWLNFVKYLVEFKKQVVVYVPQDPDYPFMDDSFISEIPSDVTIIKKPIVEPYKWASFFSSSKTKQISKGIIPTKEQSWVDKSLLWIRGNFFIPDARKFWVRPSVNFLKNYIKDHYINTIITTGPPHSVHLIGMGLKRWDAELNWVADFRDPWTTIGYHTELKLTQASKNKHIALESKVLNQADKIIVTSFTTAKEFKQKTNKPIKVITNGYLDVTTEPQPLSTKFSLAHIGSLLSGRNPEVLWETLFEICNENAEFSNDLELILAGTVSREVVDSIHRAGLKNVLQLKGYLSHQEAVALQQTSQILLLLEIDAPKTKGIIPGKFFEYMAARRPILALGPKGWDIARLIRDTQTGRFFEYDRQSELKKYLLDSYQSYKDNELEVHPKGIEAYHRRELTKSLVEFIS